MTINLQLASRHQVNDIDFVCVTMSYGKTKSDEDDLKMNYVYLLISCVDVAEEIQDLCDI